MITNACEKLKIHLVNEYYNRCLNFLSRHFDIALAATRLYHIEEYLPFLDKKSTFHELAPKYRDYLTLKMSEHAYKTMVKQIYKDKPSVINLVNVIINKSIIGTETYHVLHDFYIPRYELLPKSIIKTLKTKSDFTTALYNMYVEKCRNYLSDYVPVGKRHLAQKKYVHEYIPISPLDVFRNLNYTHDRKLIKPLPQNILSSIEKMCPPDITIILNAHRVRNSELLVEETDNHVLFNLPPTDESKIDWLNDFTLYSGRRAISNIRIIK